MSTEKSYEILIIDPYGRVIKGTGMPVSDFASFSQTMGEDAIMCPSVCNFYDAIVAVAHNEENLKEWEEYIERRLQEMYSDDPHKRWEKGTDTGISSMTIFHAIKNGRRYERAGVPRDAGDFGRCYRLVQKFPEWKNELSKVVELNPEWKNIVDNWDKLCSAYEAKDEKALKDLLS